MVLFYKINNSVKCLNMNIKVIKTRRRKRTASAQLKNGTLEIRLPAWISFTEEQKIVKKFIASFKKKSIPKVASDKDLKKLADQLNRQYFQGELKYSIYWSKRQNSIQGSCTIRNKTIRISERIKEVPLWVLKGVIVHELTHLLVPNHSKKFWEIANRYPLMERSRGYLIAFEKYSGKN
jgi:predicted metal-dependent hydrolase